jgi:hypothetical protein
MSDNELDAFANLPTRYQCAQRLNYHALEEDHIFKKLRLTLESTL